MSCLSMRPLSWGRVHPPPPPTTTTTTTTLSNVSMMLIHHNQSSRHSGRHACRWRQTQPHMCSGRWRQTQPHMYSGYFHSRHQCLSQVNPQPWGPEANAWLYSQGHLGSGLVKHNQLYTLIINFISWMTQNTIALYHHRTVSVNMYVLQDDFRRIWMVCAVLCSVEVQM